MIDPDLEGAVAAARATDDVTRAATLAVRGYGPQILGYLHAVVGPEDADDAFSTFCEFLWRQLPDFRAESSLLTWLYCLAWGAARRIFEDPHRKRGVRLSTDAMEQIAQEVRSSSALYLKQAAADQLSRIRSQLDPAEQTLLVLRVDRDMAWTEVATIMDLDEVALRKRFERLKDKIKRIGEVEGMIVE